MKREKQPGECPICGFYDCSCPKSVKEAGRTINNLMEYYRGEIDRGFEKEFDRGYAQGSYGALQAVLTSMKMEVQK